VIGRLARERRRASIFGHETELIAEGACGGLVRTIADGERDLENVRGAFGQSPACTILSRLRASCQEARNGA
jgi:hypothetical protein